MKLQYLAPFVLVAASATVGLDYMVQSKNLSEDGDMLSAPAYIGTVSDRFGSARQEVTDARETRSTETARLEKLRAPLNTYLPAAPAGWARFSWSDELATPLEHLKQKDDIAGALLEEMQHTNVQVAMLGHSGKDLRARQQQEEYQFYSKAEALISIRVRYAEPREVVSQTEFEAALEDAADPAKALSNPIAAQRNMAKVQEGAMQMAMRNMAGVSMVEWTPFARIQGVTFAQGVNIAEDPSPVVRLKADLGAGITLKVRALADKQTIVELLQAIDYDTLNALQPVQMAGIGKGGVTLIAADETAKQAVQPAPAQAPKPVVAEEPTEVAEKPKVRRAAGFGGSSCTMVGQMKRCRIGTD